MDDIFKWAVTGVMVSALMMLIVAAVAAVLLVAYALIAPAFIFLFS